MCNRKLGVTLRVALLAVMTLISPSLGLAMGKGEGIVTPSAEDQEVLNSIKRAYEDLGYVPTKVVFKQSTSNTRLFEVRLGKRYRVKDIVIRGNRRIPVTSLLQGGPKVGDIYSPKLVRKFIDGISRKYTAQGVARPVITPETSVDNADDTVTLTLKVQEEKYPPIDPPDAFARVRTQSLTDPWQRAKDHSPPAYQFEIFAPRRPARRILSPSKIHASLFRPQGMACPHSSRQ